MGKNGIKSKAVSYTIIASSGGECREKSEGRETIMARGVRKTWEEKITVLDQEIGSLEEKLKGMKEQKKELQKKRQEELLSQLCETMEEKGVSRMLSVELKDVSADAMS